MTYHAAILLDIPGLRNTSHGDATKSSISAREQRSAEISTTANDRIILTGRAASQRLRSSGQELESLSRETI
jgi:hypothetical protein